MNDSIIPATYDQWRHCIIVDCGLELTDKYIKERIAALENNQGYHTQQFVKLYGEQHLQSVIGWFKQAQN